MFEENPIEGTPLLIMKAHLPVSESFGFQGVLRLASKGHAFPQMVFDHWKNLPGDPLDANENMATVLVAETRKRKGLKPGVPSVDYFHDKEQKQK